jgi:ribosomal protein S8
MHYTFLRKVIETVVEVLAEAGYLSDMKFSASTSGFDDEISLYDGTFCESGRVFKHFMAVDKEDEMQIVLKMDGSQYKWTFKAGVGSSCST